MWLTTTWTGFCLHTQTLNVHSGFQLIEGKEREDNTVSVGACGKDETHGRMVVDIG